LGANLGDRFATLAEAKNLVSKRIGQVVKASSYYETQPWGKTDQPEFINQALEVATELPPPALLKAILEIEKLLGRSRQEDLTLPHPQLHERNFVLVPMLEIAPNKQHPIFKKTIEELYEACEDDLEVVMLDEEDIAKLQTPRP
jgi:2-amino-4-hydroxy-6-hydroxymethyldihydropteridine diphosphokinase